MIGEASGRSVLVQGFRSIARTLERPEATVRGRLRQWRERTGAQPLAAGPIGATCGRLPSQLAEAF
ncbi:hypothetical protein GCM10018952_74940 [Streptosporangium vulgare]